mmetsp:Transcript_13057/g.27746  ORF Transcript_13057/g.27746 Transcript_13057/m.27746 type:complete len:90 (+) Transcript_13057:547-816(+)
MAETEVDPSSGILAIAAIGVRSPGRSSESMATFIILTIQIFCNLDVRASKTLFMQFTGDNYRRFDCVVVEVEVPSGLTNSKSHGHGHGE